MSKGWSLERLQALAPADLQKLYANADRVGTAQSKAVIRLINEHNLLKAKPVPRSSLAKGMVKSALKPWTQYQQVVVETYVSTLTGTSEGIHVRPAKGENFSQDMKVECSREMRKNFPVGTRFKIWAKVVEKKSGNAFLYTHFDWPFTLVSD